MPEKEQFRDGESFYGTLFHEMTHSTGAEGVLDRIKPTAFGSKEYSREELVAELGSALVSQRYGMIKHIKEDSCAYLKGWLDELKESPQFIKTTLLDVKRATSLITQKVDKIAQELEQDVNQEQKNKTSKPEKTFYTSVVYLQLAEDTNQLDELKNKGDYKGVMTLIKEHYDGNCVDELYTQLTPFQHKGDTLLVEDKDFAVVYNGSVGGTYELMLKHTEQYSALIDKYMVRHLVKPGVTGWAQVTGYRGETKTLEQMEGRVKRDVWYIENWTFFLDLKIIVVTVLNMFKGEKNAY